MDFKSCVSSSDFLIIEGSINKYILKNDYENAFHMFLIQVARLNNLDRDELIRIFYKSMHKKMLESN
jgi:hypothetical protein